MRLLKVIVLMQASPCGLLAMSETNEWEQRSRAREDNLVEEERWRVVERGGELLAWAAIAATDIPLSIDRIPACYHMPRAATVDWDKPTILDSFSLVKGSHIHLPNQRLSSATTNPMPPASICTSPIDITIERLWDLMPFLRNFRAWSVPTRHVL